MCRKIHANALRLSRWIFYRSIPYHYITYYIFLYILRRNTLHRVKWRGEHHCVVGDSNSVQVHVVPRKNVLIVRAFQRKYWNESFELFQRKALYKYLVLYRLTITMVHYQCTMVHRQCTMVHRQFTMVLFLMGDHTSNNIVCYNKSWRLWRSNPIQLISIHLSTDSKTCIKLADMSSICDMRPDQSRVKGHAI